MLITTTLFLGLIGVGVRFYADEYFKWDYIPLSTFIVNLAGCFIAGWVFTSTAFSSSGKTAVLIGFCGGLTTFSALILQSLQMIRSGDWIKAIAYLMISQLFGLLCAWAGMKFGDL